MKLTDEQRQKILYKNIKKGSILTIPNYLKIYDKPSMLAKPLLLEMPFDKEADDFIIVKNIYNKVFAEINLTDHPVSKNVFVWISQIAGRGLIPMLVMTLFYKINNIFNKEAYNEIHKERSKN